MASDTGKHPGSTTALSDEAEHAAADPTAPVGVLSQPDLVNMPPQSDSTLGEPAFRATTATREEMEARNQEELRRQSERTS